MNIDLALVQKALERRKYRPATLEGSEQFAAVAAILREREARAEVLLIRRAVHDKDPWSGHMAFPGGRRDPSDPDVLFTAVRETAEEVGLELNPAAHLVGRLDDLPAIARGRRVGLVIAPFVFAIDGDPNLVLARAEVDEALWAPLGPLAAGECNTTFAYQLDGKRFDLPAYDVNGRVVWGLTHRMLGALFETFDELAPFASGGIP